MLTVAEPSGVGRFPAAGCEFPLKEGLAMTAAHEPESVRGRVSEEEWRTRVHLAACYRLVALYEWDDWIFTHISARVPGPEHHFLINPYGMLFEEITASSLVKVGLDGAPVVPSPFPVNPAGFVIHSAIHAAREDALCVIHLHTPHGQAVAAQRAGLLPITQTAMAVYGDLAYHDYEGVAVDLSERERLVADLGEKCCMILRNHGTLTVGAGVAEAFARTYFLERACEAQVLALSGGVELAEASPSAQARTAAEARAGLDLVVEKLAWPALLRKLDREDPSYAT
jgi:ribulose-5-phosphate 4-epimerase/fuculose-1-phosphate aldolase